MQLVFSDAARRDLAEAAAWFEENSTLGGAAFTALIQETVVRISKVPLAAPRWLPAPRYRAWTIQQVNYRVFYEVVEQSIQIVALAHTSRRPGYWLRRVT